MRANLRDQRPTCKSGGMSGRLIRLAKGADARLACAHLAPGANSHAVRNFLHSRPVTHSIPLECN